MAVLTPEELRPVRKESSPSMDTKNKEKSLINSVTQALEDWYNSPQCATARKDAINQATSPVVLSDPEIHAIESPWLATIGVRTK